ncbi:MAG: AAA family ATPase, partial [Desulfovibrio sp.]|nr:AAA family ATPase [Desulfovibrio sp.]
RTALRRANHILFLAPRSRSKSLFPRLTGGAVTEKPAKSSLIDEYDCPLVDTYDNPDYQEEIRKTLCEFYRQIKSCDEYIHVAYITGISKFSRAGVFSTANNIIDYSTHLGYGAMFGYTDEEIAENFSDYLPVTAETLNMHVGSILPNMKAYYDGYTFCGKSSIYNPISVLSFFSNMRFKDYWVETGSQEFIKNYFSSYNIKFEDFDDGEYKAH